MNKLPKEVVNKLSTYQSAVKRVEDFSEKLAVALDYPVKTAGYFTPRQRSPYSLPEGFNEAVKAITGANLRDYCGNCNGTGYVGYRPDEVEPCAMCLTLEELVVRLVDLLLLR